MNLGRKVLNRMILGARLLQERPPVIPVIQPVLIESQFVKPAVQTVVRPYSRFVPVVPPVSVILQPQEEQPQQPQQLQQPPQLQQPQSKQEEALRVESAS